MCWNLLYLLSKAWRSKGWQGGGEKKNKIKGHGVSRMLETWRRITRAFYGAENFRSDLCWRDVKRFFRGDNVTRWLREERAAGGRELSTWLGITVFHRWDTNRHFVLASLLGLFCTMHHVRGKVWESVFKKRIILSNVTSPFAAVRAASPRRAAHGVENIWRTPYVATIKALCQRLWCDKRKTAQFAHDTCGALCSAPQCENCPFLRLWLFAVFVVFVVGRGSAALGLQRQQPAEQVVLSVCLCVFRCVREEKNKKKKKTESTSQSNDTVKILYPNMYANDFNPFNNLAGGHWSLPPPPSTVLFKPYGRIWENVDATLNIYPEHTCFFIISKSWI